MTDAMLDSDPELNLNGMQFSTWDVDNDMNGGGSCSFTNDNVGWWFNNCAQACLTCSEPQWTPACHVSSWRMLVMVETYPWA
jgi:hypothetical protein